MHHIKMENTYVQDLQLDNPDAASTGVCIYVVHVYIYI